MTKKDLFRIIIKAFGLYSIITVLFSVLPSNLTWVIGMLDIVGILWILGTLIVTIGLFVLLIYKSDKVISILSLDKGFDNEQIDFQNFNIENIVKLALIIIGGLVFIKNIPSFLSYTLFAFKSFVQSNVEHENIIKYRELKDYIYWFSSGINIIIGYYLLTNFSRISKYIIRKDNRNNIA